MKHIVGFSGGIDSQACARWVLNRNNPHHDKQRRFLRKQQTKIDTKNT